MIMLFKMITIFLFGEKQKDTERVRIYIEWRNRCNRGSEVRHSNDQSLYYLFEEGQ